MRGSLCLLAVLCVSIANADDLLLMPTARHLSSGLSRLEAWGYQGVQGGSLATGVGPSFDTKLELDSFRGDLPRFTGDFAYYYLSPIADITPGLSVGVRDAANATQDGRRVYACGTMNRSLPKIARSGYFEVTVGFQAARKSSPFGGVSVPLTGGFALIGEYDGYRFVGGLRLSAGSGLYAEIAARAGIPYLALGIKS